MGLLDEIIKLSQVGSSVLLMFAVIGAVKGWWVPRWMFNLHVKSLTEQNAAYRQMVSDLHDIFETAEDR